MATVNRQVSFAFLFVTKKDSNDTHAPFDLQGVDLVNREVPFDLTLTLNLPPMPRLHLQQVATGNRQVSANEKLLRKNAHPRPPVAREAMNDAITC